MIFRPFGLPYFSWLLSLIFLVFLAQLCIPPGHMKLDNVENWLPACLFNVYSEYIYAWHYRYKRAHLAKGTIAVKELQFWEYLLILLAVILIVLLDFLLIKSY